MNTELKPGHVVRLKSGGPAMTVASVKAENCECFCMWFVDGSPRSSVFPCDTLDRGIVDSGEFYQDPAPKQP